MADITQTPANVAAIGSATVLPGTAGDTLTQGNAAYKATNGQWVLAMSGGNVQQAGSLGMGILLNSASPGQPISLFTSGSCNLGATLGVGTTYCLSRNPGRICPDSDVLSNNYVTIFGVAAGASNIASPNGGAPFASGTLRA